MPKPPMRWPQPRSGWLNGNIVAVGSLNEVKESLSDYQLSEDRRYADKVLLPGFVENHLHPTLAGILLPSDFITPYPWVLPSQEVEGIQNREDYLAQLTDRVGASQGQGLFITWGYHQYFHGELSRADLDQIAPSQAVIVWHRSFHEVILNTRAMELLGLQAEDFNQNPAVDFNAGHFWELGLFAIFPKLAPHILSPARYQAGVLEGLKHAQNNGITTVVDQGFPLLDFNLEKSQLEAVLAQNKLPLSVYVVGNGKTLAMEGIEAGLRNLEGLPTQNTEHITFLPKQVKLLADGAFYSQLMQMEDGYLDGHHGEWITPPDELEALASAYWSAGFQLHVHVNGDKGLNVVLGIIEKLAKEMPREHKTVLHHYGYSGEKHAKRLAQLGISVSANPYYLWALADKYAEIGLGPERAHAISRLGDLERNNVTVSLHSDLPMAPASPLALAGVAASRITAAGNTLMPSEKMSPEEALKAITINAAAAVDLDHKIGSIEVGKQADFTIVERNPLEIDPKDWSTIKVIDTLKNGLPTNNPL